MRVLAAALAVLLLVAICSQAEADPRVSHSAALSKNNKVYRPGSCCYSYISRPIPCSNIIHAYMTNSLCSQPAVILFTRRERYACVDPSAHWIQECLKDKDMELPKH